MPLNDRQRALRERFIDQCGYWNESWEATLELDEEFFAAHVEMVTAATKHSHLSPKDRELLLIAVDSAATHMFLPGLREHMRLALELGATSAEIMEVMELTATLGIHAVTVGVPILLEELEARGTPFDLTNDERHTQLKEEFTKNRGYWNAMWEGVLVLDPDFFKSYSVFSSVPWEHGTLSPKMKEFVYTAFDCAATHMYLPGLRLHIQNALGYGATGEEIMEVFALATQLGVHALNVGAPILAEELAARAAQ